jgi:hypothetical protein
LRVYPCNSGLIGHVRRSGLLARHQFLNPPRLEQSGWTPSPKLPCSVRSSQASEEQAIARVSLANCHDPVPARAVRDCSKSEHNSIVPNLITVRSITYCSMFTLVQFQNDCARYYPEALISVARVTAGATERGKELPSRILHRPPRLRRLSATPIKGHRFPRVTGTSTGKISCEFFLFIVVQRMWSAASMNSRECDSRLALK